MDYLKNKILFYFLRSHKDVYKRQGLDTYDNFIKNKNDVIRLLSYDPVSYTHLMNF